MHRVTVSAYRGGRRVRLHTFGAAVEEPGLWFVLGSPSRRQERLPEAQREPRRVTGLDADGLLGAQRVDLGEGVTPRGATLAVVLDAVHAAGRREVDLDDVKVVLSQLGSRITALAGLPDEQRQHAAAALYTDIAARCTSV